MTADTLWLVWSLAGFVSALLIRLGKRKPMSLDIWIVLTIFGFISLFAAIGIGLAYLGRLEL